MSNACFSGTVLNSFSGLLQASLDCTFDIERGTINAAPSESRSGFVSPALRAVVCSVFEALKLALLSSVEELSLVSIPLFAFLPTSCSCCSRTRFRSRGSTTRLKQFIAAPVTNKEIDIRLPMMHADQVMRERFGSWRSQGLERYWAVAAFKVPSYAAKWARAVATSAALHSRKARRGSRGLGDIIMN
ncbi:hypothetical protein BU25DRAFT_271632 [Macroventuria anomochaeta]|uniref:Uncharacterized protein n=1 Tax=Macroventuria anomochaeta TaxID=301207 RepID=A0ACB6S650_9PLEO|nr:uncharacterized protein BU25DRAFT_271632 [Macroventuria anomochaeta]KAF2629671.1 hypothetical protein BU25DRAFT_271632 [Macroventuria anomochaeta]